MRGTYKGVLLANYSCPRHVFLSLKSSSKGRLQKANTMNFVRNQITVKFHQMPMMFMTEGVLNESMLGGISEAPNRICFTCTCLILCDAKGAPNC